MASYVLNLLYISGKYLSRTTGRTLLLILNRSSEFQRNLINHYGRMICMVGSEQNMFEIMHNRLPNIHMYEMNENVDGFNESDRTHLGMDKEADSKDCLWHDVIDNMKTTEQVGKNLTINAELNVKDQPQELKPIKGVIDIGDVENLGQPKPNVLLKNINKLNLDSTKEKRKEDLSFLREDSLNNLTNTLYRITLLNKEPSDKPVRKNKKPVILINDTRENRAGLKIISSSLATKDTNYRSKMDGLSFYILRNVNGVYGKDGLHRSIDKLTKGIIGLPLLIKTENSLLDSATNLYSFFFGLNRKELLTVQKWLEHDSCVLTKPWNCRMLSNFLCSKPGYRNSLIIPKEYEKCTEKNEDHYVNSKLDKPIVQKFNDNIKQIEEKINKEANNKLDKLTSILNKSNKGILIMSLKNLNWQKKLIGDINNQLEIIFFNKNGNWSNLQDTTKDLGNITDTLIDHLEKLVVVFCGGYRHIPKPTKLLPTSELTELCQHKRQLHHTAVDLKTTPLIKPSQRNMSTPVESKEIKLPSPIVIDTKYLGKLHANDVQITNCSKLAKLSLKKPNNLQDKTSANNKECLVRTLVIRNGTFELQKVNQDKTRSSFYFERIRNILKVYQKHKIVKFENVLKNMFKTSLFLQPDVDDMNDQINILEINKKVFDDMESNINTIKIIQKPTKYDQPSTETNKNVSDNDYLKNLSGNYKTPYKVTNNGIRNKSISLTKPSTSNKMVLKNDDKIKDYKQIKFGNLQNQLLLERKKQLLEVQLPTEKQLSIVVDDPQTLKKNLRESLKSFEVIENQQKWILTYLCEQLKNKILKDELKLKQTEANHKAVTINIHNELPFCFRRWVNVSILPKTTLWTVKLKKLKSKTLSSPFAKESWYNTLPPTAATANKVVHSKKYRFETKEIETKMGDKIKITNLVSYEETDL